ncbi:MAG: flagellar hook-associated protein FlgK [Verrucomicrobia bacterium]|nr:flagellar hook-associated protein FlgK [Verrucomicrobiota bacterium]
MPLGLIGAMELAKRGIDTNRQGIELIGHNLSNISNPAYARQRLKVQTSDALPSPSGPIGTGSKVTAIEQIRDQLLDNQIVSETGVSSYLEARRKALELAEVNLGQQLDRQASTPEGAAASLGVGGQFGIVEGLSDFFNSMQALSTNPNSTADRQVVVLRAESLTEKFNNVSERLSDLRADLNVRVEDDVELANELLQQVSDLSRSIGASEAGLLANANDIRDRRQEKLEALGQLVNIQYSENPVSREFTLSVGGVEFITANAVVTTLETFSDADAGTQVQAATGDPLTLTKGSIWGTIRARDDEVATVSSDLDTLAGAVFDQVNAIHSPGFALDGTSPGQPFFVYTGTGANPAAEIRLNSVLRNDPTKIQASETGEAGDNGIALQLARLGNTPQAGLGNLTFNERYSQTIANLGQALSNTNNQAQDQDAINRMLLRQRDSLGGVSIDEEMANMIVFQRAFQASARMISTLDELLQSVINLGV